MGAQRELSLSLVGPQLGVVKLRKMKVAARGLGAQFTVGAPRFEPVGAPARVLAGRLLGPQRPVGPDAPPTGLLLRSTLVSKPALKRAQIGAAALGPVLEMAPRRRGINRGTRTGVSPQNSTM